MPVLAEPVGARTGAPVVPAAPPNPAQNPVPNPAPGRQRQARLPLASTAIVAAIVLAGLGVQSLRQTPGFRTISGLAAALQTKGLGCESPLVDQAHDTRVREQGECRIMGQPVTLMTFSNRARRDEVLGARRDRYRAAGDAWIVVTRDAPTARAIAQALGGVAP